MSRIDEALRRVSGDSVAEHLGATKPFDRQARRPEDTLEAYPREGRGVLESYAKEGRGAAERTHVPEVTSPKTIAAPRTGVRRQLAPLNPDIDGKLIVGGHASSIAVEQYRRMAATLHQLQVDKGLKTLMVTSALPQEGKTLTVANLALTLSESYKRRVLLIDADLRRPSIHTLFQLPNTHGLSEGLRTAPTELAYLEVSPFLSVLPAGAPDQNPMAKLTSDRMRALLAESAAKFDWVLLDAPPVGLMPDAHLLAQLVEGVLFVIRANATPHHLIERAIGAIGRDALLGTILNRADEHAVPANDYLHHYYVNSAGASQE
jgi:capsular exopolysaccharide synthesis family protein